MPHLRQPTIAVIGDVNIDVRLTLEAGWLADAPGDIFLPSRMIISVAGTAANFAQAATAHFDHVLLFARVGDDGVATLAAQQLDHPGISLHLAVDRERPSRYVLILREATASGIGRRIMIPRLDAANHFLLDEDLEGLWSGLDEIDILLVDGYSYLHQPARATVSAAVTRAAEAGVLVAVDVVPHDLSERWELENLRDVLQPAAIVIAEAQTMARFLDIGSEFDHVDRVRTILPALWSTFGKKVFLLRFGIGNIDQSFIAWPDGTDSHSFTGYQETTDVAGFGDRLTARQLADVLRRQVPQA